MDTEAAPPAWDEGFADSLVGSVVLIGLTYPKADGTLDRQEQMSGVVTEVGETGIVIDLSGARHGEPFSLPPHLSAFQPARRGEYRLRSTGEVVVDPDFISNWTIRAPD